MAREHKFLPINMAMLRMHVIVTWETEAEEIESYARQHKVEVAKRFVEDFKENTKDAIGVCMVFDNENPDVLVWLRKRPKHATDYGTLYHELYHAVDNISESRNLDDEAEARAYAFEYLATEANKFFWNKR
jgi:hypothetical protein